MDLFFRLAFSSISDLIRAKVLLGFLLTYSLWPIFLAWLSDTFQEWKIVAIGWSTSERYLQITKVEIIEHIIIKVKCFFLLKERINHMQLGKKGHFLFFYSKEFPVFFTLLFIVYYKKRIIVKLRMMNYQLLSLNILDYDIFMSFFFLQSS